MSNNIFDGSGELGLVWTGAVARYKGNVIAFVPEGKTATFSTANHTMEGDLEIMVGASERGLCGEITFMIGGSTYHTATHGMTWGEWIESGYAPDELRVSDGEIVFRFDDGQRLFVCGEWGHVMSHEHIVHGFKYTTEV